MSVSVGDVVTLKSGGPRMTVDFLSRTTGLASCTWFKGDEVVTKDFNPNTLVQVPPMEKSASEVSES